MEPVIFMGRCYVPTHRGVRRASATLEEMESFPTVHILRPLSYSTKTSNKKTSKNSKAEGAYRKKNTPLPYAEQQRRYLARKEKEAKQIIN